MKITLIHPAVGKIPGKKYIRAWQMESLPIAQLTALMPKNVELSFWDDRIEEIQYEENTDLVAMTVETYTAKRAYQIASEFRRKNVPVIMGGFHPTLCPDEVAEYADCVVVGESENIWLQILADLKNGKLAKKYVGDTCTFKKNIIPDRSLLKNKDYVNITLLEAGRGCRFNCEFCSIHVFYKRKHNYRNIKNIVEEVNQLKKSTKLFFFVDDNIVSDTEQAAQLFKALIPLKIKWVGQTDILIAKNTELLDLMVDSGCQGVLIGFESLSPDNQRVMNKSMIPSMDRMTNAIKKIHKKGIRIYATFLFGYEFDTPNEFNRVLDFCMKNKFFMVGFNHLTPFPGTQLYKRLEKENKLLYNKWWLSDEYTYGMIPFKSKLKADIIEKECRRIRRKFYSIPSILYRLTNLKNINSLLMFTFYLLINMLLRKDTGQRKSFPLGDIGYNKELLKIN